jgi:hypothetical protein
LVSLNALPFRLLLHGFAYNLVNLFRLQLPQPWRSAQIETLRAQLFKILDRHAPPDHALNDVVHGLPAHFELFGKGSAGFISGRVKIPDLPNLPRGQF